MTYIYYKYYIIYLLILFFLINYFLSLEIFFCTYTYTYTYYYINNNNNLCINIFYTKKTKEYAKNYDEDRTMK